MKYQTERLHEALEAIEQDYLAAFSLTMFWPLSWRENEQRWLWYKRSVDRVKAFQKFD